MTLDQRQHNRERIRVLFVIVQLDMMGGSESLVRNLIRNIDRDRFDPSIAWFLGGDPMKEFVKLDIPLYHIPKTKRFDFETMRLLSELIESKRIDVVNAHHFLSMAYSYYGCKIKNHRGLIYTEHSEWELDEISWGWKKIGSYMLNRADMSIGVGENVTEKLKSTFDLQTVKAITVNNGVDIKTFHDDSHMTLSREQLGIGPQDKVIGIVANFRKVKNHIFLLRAFKSLLKKQKSAKLLLIGTEPKGEADNTLPDIRRFIKTQRLSDAVRLLGYRSDVPELLRIMDVFCLTSLKEGLPIGLIEAMTAGLPVIGTNVDGIQDIIVDRINGYLVELNNDRELFEAMNSLLSDRALREKMGRESTRIVKTDYDLSECVARYQEQILAACAH